MLVASLKSAPHAGGVLIVPRQSRAESLSMCSVPEFGTTLRE